MSSAVDLFGGPGGWDVAAETLGVESHGVEYDPVACETRRAAGLRTIEGDVSLIDPLSLPPTDGLIASPPCTAFSMAGDRAGIEHLPALLAAIAAGDWSALRHLDPTIWLPLEVGRWATARQPRWIACEQVPPALVLWRAYERSLGALGYSTWCGVLNAADFGVPQTRKRAVLLATLDGVAHPPVPTHAEDPAPSLFGEEQRWVTMAEALGWGLTNRPGYTFCGSNEGGPDLAGGSGTRQAIADARETGGWQVGFPRSDDKGTSDDGYRERDWRSADEPSFAVTEKARSWIRRERSGDRAEEGFDPEAGPAQTLTSKARSWSIVDAPPDEIADAVVRTGANSMVTGRTGSRAGDGDVQPYERSVHEPAPTVDRKVGTAWKVVLNPGQTDTQPNRRTYDATEEPAPTVAFGHDAGSWKWEGEPCPCNMLGAIVGVPGTAHRSDESGECEWFADRFTEPPTALNTGRDWKPGGTREDAQTIPIDQPAPTVSAVNAQFQWIHDRPATTVAGDPRVWPPGHKVNADDIARLGAEEAADRYGDRAGTGAIRVSIADAATLQTFPLGYPWQGSRTKQFEQVGNAVPPLLALHVLAAVLGVDPPVDQLPQWRVPNHQEIRR